MANRNVPIYDSDFLEGLWCSSSMPAGNYNKIKATLLPEGYSIARMDLYINDAIVASELAPFPNAVADGNTYKITWDLSTVNGVPNTTGYPITSIPKVYYTDFNGNLVYIAQVKTEPRLTTTPSTPCVLACTATTDKSVVTIGASDLITFSSGATLSGGCQGNTGFVWNFGDGQTSTSQNTTHTYSAAGNYTWALSASNSGVTCSKTGNIVVSPATVTLSGTIIGDFVYLYDAKAGTSGAPSYGRPTYYLKTVPRNTCYSSMPAVSTYASTDNLGITNNTPGIFVMTVDYPNGSKNFLSNADGTFSVNVPFYPNSPYDVYINLGAISWGANGGTADDISLWKNLGGCILGSQASGTNNFQHLYYYNGPSSANGYYFSFPWSAGSSDYSASIYGGLMHFPYLYGSDPNITLLKNRAITGLSYGRPASNIYLTTSTVGPITIGNISLWDSTFLSQHGQGLPNAFPIQCWGPIPIGGAFDGTCISGTSNTYTTGVENRPISISPYSFPACFPIIYINGVLQT